MTNGTQAMPPTPAPAPEKKGKGLKIFLGILGGCLVILIILGIVGYFMVKRAAKKAGVEFEKALNEIEKINTLELNELGNIQFNFETNTER